MNEWVVSYESEKALEEIKKTGTVMFEPEFKELQFILIQSYLSKETIMNIEGVTDCQEQKVGTLFQVN